MTLLQQASWAVACLFRAVIFACVDAPLSTRISDTLHRRVSNASLEAFRALFGAVMFVALVRYALRGFFRDQLLTPKLLLSYPGFELVQRWPGQGMQVHLTVLCLAALSISLGLFTRLSCIVFALGFSYLELLDRTTYLNHYYLVSCLSLLLALSPVGRRFSLDCWRKGQQPATAQPLLHLLALRCQVAVVYLFAGTAKLNGDWLLRAEPLKSWLFAAGDLPWIGGLLALPATAFVASWAGALFDLTIVPLLLFRRTRSAAFALLVLFHVSTGLLLPIGMFPWIMIVSATLLLSPHWPVGGPDGPSHQPLAGVTPGWLKLTLLLHCAVQLGLPAYRQLHFPDAAWTYRGFDFSWRVMIADKAGYLTFRVCDQSTGLCHTVRPSSYLAPHQGRAVSVDPALIEQLAQHIAEDERRRSGNPVSIYADSYASMNGRAARRLVDPRRDLAERKSERPFEALVAVP